MKITMEATEEIIEGRGRIWNGVTEGGVRVKVLVSALGSQSDADLAAIEAELSTLKTRGAYRLGVLMDLDKPVGSS